MDVKLFCDNESKGSLKWFCQRSRKLIIQTDSDEHYLKLEFQKLAGTCEDNNPDADENFVNLITDIYPLRKMYIQPMRKAKLYCWRSQWKLKLLM